VATGHKKDGDWFSWALIVFLFAVGAWPIALFLLFAKLFAGDGKQKQAAPPPLENSVSRQKTADVQSARQSKAKKAAKKMTKTPAAKKSTVKWLKVIGIVLAALGLTACYNPISMMIWLGEVDAWYVRELLQALAVAIAGGAMAAKGISMDKQLKRYAKYLAVIGDREAMDVGQLARTLGYSERQVEKDLQKMIDRGYFGGTAYLNVELGYLFRSGRADEELKQKRAESRASVQTPQEAEEGYSGILRNIRRANDNIADPVLSAKIDRLEEIASKIFRAVEADPQKAGRIDTFLNYYLPTTQKLLDSYAEFEAAGVEGENLRQAKSRIESTMDAIVRGFEHQLDELYKADALDVDSDIRVMKTMLHRDTASVDQDFGLGRHAAAAAHPGEVGENSGTAAAQQAEEQE